MGAADIGVEPGCSLYRVISLPFAQQLDPIDMAVEELRTRVEAASRSNQRVFVDDFTGLN